YTGTAFAADHLFKWGYNTRSELTAADRYQGTDPDSPGTQYGTKGAFDYAYDPIGNRETFQLDGGSVRDYTTNAVNQYTAIDDPSESFTYDADGNLIQDSLLDYVWDAENRLVEVISRIELGSYPSQYENGDIRCQFKYDYMGRRVERIYS